MAVRRPLSGLWHPHEGDLSGRAGATRTFGPHIESLLGYFHERHHVGYERLVEVCREVFRLPISEGGIDGALRRLAERARLTYEGIGARVRAGPVVDSDETGARVAGRNAWHWVFQTPEASEHVIVRRRNADVIAAFLGETRPESWVPDLWSPQVKVDADTHQLCLAHQIRNLTCAAEADGELGLVWAVELRHLLGRAIDLHRQRATLTPAQVARRRRRIENAVDRLVFRISLPDQPDTANARRLQARYREHRASLFVFLDRPDVPPTNNASEQALRPSVILRKVTGGYCPWAGAEVSAILTSLFATARKRGQNLSDALRSLAGPSPLQAAAPARRAVTLPASRLRAVVRRHPELVPLQGRPTHRHVSGPASGLSFRPAPGCQTLPGEARKRRFAQSRQAGPDRP